MPKRICRIAGFTFITGVVAVGQSGLAEASETVDTLDTSTTIVETKSDHVTLLEGKYSKSAYVTENSSEWRKIDKAQSARSVSCPSNPADRVVDYSYTIDGVPGFTTLGGNVDSGDSVRVDFEIAEGCTDVELSLAAYDAPIDFFTRENASQQVLKDSDTGEFDAGSGSLEVVTPDCFYQVDFVRGEVLTTLGPENSNNFYADQGRLIDADNGGQACETPEEPEIPEVPEEPETPVIPEEPETPDVPEVLVETPEQVVEVAGLQIEEVSVEADELATTGFDTTLPLASVGASLLLLGFAMERASRRVQLRRATVGVGGR